MQANQLLVDAFGRVRDSVDRVLDGLDGEALLWRADADANPIGWLVWHLTRVQDDHVAGVADRPQVWTHDGWFERFALPYPVGDLGYGHSSDEVGRFSVTDPDLLRGYHEAVTAETNQVLAGLDDDDFDRVVDEQWDPPVTAAVRLVSVVNDVAQHVGQAAYVRGLIQRRSGTS